MRNVMYNWSVVLSRSDSAEYETLRVNGIENSFKSKRNAQLFAESYVLDHIMTADGINRLEPFAVLPLPTTRMKGLEVTRDYISSVEKDSNIPNLQCHYIVSAGNHEPWGLTVHRLHIVTTSITTTKMEDQEVDEEQEIETDKHIVVPGRLWNGIKIERVKEKIKQKVKKQIETRITTPIRHVISKDLFTVSLLKTKTMDPIEHERAMMNSTELAKNFVQTNTAKMIFAASESISSYKLSELKTSNAEEFGYYRRLEKKKADIVSTPKSIITLRKTTNKPGVHSTVNTGASLASLGADIIARRKAMFT